MQLLLLNAGSSSLKFSWIETEGERPLAMGMGDWASLPTRYTFREHEALPIQETVSWTGHGEAVRRIVADVQRSAVARAGGLNLAAVAHRVVHGGTHFTQSIRVTAEVKAALEQLAELAPLHNPPSLEALAAAEAVLPGVAHVAVFDTAFHATLPPEAYVYPTPYSWFSDWGVRRFGFHGLSHAYCAARAAEMLNIQPSPLYKGGLRGVGLSSAAKTPCSPPSQGGHKGLPEMLRRDKPRLVIAHLGHGASVTAVKDGQSMDTTMGFTPLEGLMMATRSGSIDPGVLLFMQKRHGLSPEELDRVLNHESGLLGVSGVSADLRKVRAAADSGNARASLALSIYAWRARQAIGAMAATLGGVDALVFAGGVGENAADVRAAICQGLDCLGLELDAVANASARPDADVSTSTSRGRILVIATREDLMMARETVRVMGNPPRSGA